MAHHPIIFAVGLQGRVDAAEAEARAQHHVMSGFSDPVNSGLISSW